jgi:hypothetical protein
MDGDATFPSFDSPYPLKPMNLLESLQHDVKRRLDSSAYFSDIPIFVMRPWVDSEETDVMAQVAEVLDGTTSTPKDGKCGAAVVVQMPTIYQVQEGMPGPYFSAKVYVRVMENPTVNQDVNGTAKSAEAIGLKVLHMLHLWNPGYSGPFMTFKWRPMRPDYEFTDGASLKVELLVDLGMKPQLRCLTPAASGTASSITLTAATVDAEVDEDEEIIEPKIWYTTDGSLPSPENPSATQYSVPFAFPGGTGQLRAAVYNVTKAGSNVLSVLY